MLQEDADDSDKAETEPSDVDMSDCESEDGKPRRAAKGKKGSTAKKQAQKAWPRRQHCAHGSTRACSSNA